MWDGAGRAPARVTFSPLDPVCHLVLNWTLKCIRVEPAREGTEGSLGAPTGRSRVRQSMHDVSGQLAQSCRLSRP